MEFRGESYGNYIATSSVHIQLIERIGRDVWNVCSQFYYIFQAVKAEDYLNYPLKSDLKQF